MSHSRSGTWPLSVPQRGIWLAHQLDTSAAAYNISEGLEIHGPVDVAMLEAAVARCVADADTLRVRLGEDAGGPFQWLADVPDFVLQMMDFSEQDDPDVCAWNWMRADTSTAVDLHTDDLWRIALVKVAEDRFFLYQRYHHILLDGFSGAAMARRIAHEYTTLAEGAPTVESSFGRLETLLEEDATYRASPAHDTDRQFWKDRLAGLPEAVTLITHPSPAVGNDRVRVTAQLPQSVLDGLRGNARQARTGWQTLVVAAAATYLNRMTGSGDLTLGLAVAARPAAVRGVPAATSNQVPLRFSMDPGMSLSEVSRAAALELRQTLRHQRYRYEDMRRDLRMVEEGQELFGLSVNIMSFDYDMRFGTYPVIPHNISNGPVESLALAILERSDGNGLTVVLDADAGGCEAEETAAHQERLLRVLEAFASADPATRIGQIDLVGAQERTRLLSRWGVGQDASTTTGTTLPQLLEAQAARTPDATAVVSGAQTLTYAQLNGRANKLARVLIDRKVGPEKVVALALPRSIDTVVAVFGVLKSGAAYVSIDPDHPAERIVHMLTDAAPTLVITDTGIRDGLPVDARTPVLLLGSAEEAADEAAKSDSEVTDSDRLCPLRPSNPALVIYTSGSTGRPKGVTLLHAGLVNLFAQHCSSLYGPAVAVSGLDRFRVALTASLSFDATWAELLWMLGGHELHLVDDGIRRDAEAVIDYVREHAIDLLDTTPSFAEQLVVSGLLRAPRRPHVLLLGGEAVPPALWATLEREPRPAAFNFYGPSETTVDALYRPLAGASRPSIGRPVGNTRVYVLDSGLQPTPVGVAGELYIAGAGLARGYLGRAELTAERFVADPYGAPGTRMYRSGDVVRWTRDGEMEFVGRADDQVKLRGFRIELAEVEAALVRDEAVAHASVVVREDRPGIRRLVGYVVPADGSEDLDPHRLREHVATRLPDYMVPAALVVMEALPLGATGKLDRSALPVPEITGSGAGRVPRTSREKALAEVFAEVLGVSEVGADDSFFDLGGDSIVSIQLVARARKAGLAITPRDVFTHKTVAALAAVVRESHAVVSEAAGAGVGAVVVTPIVRWLEELGGPMAGFQQSRLLQTPAGLTRPDLVTAVQALLDHHDALRMRLTRAHDGSWELDVPRPARSWRPRSPPGSTPRAWMPGNDGSSSRRRCAMPSAVCLPKPGSWCGWRGSTPGRGSRVGCWSWCTTWPWTECPGAF